MYSERDADFVCIPFFVCKISNLLIYNSVLILTTIFYNPMRNNIILTLLVFSILACRTPDTKEHAAVIGQIDHTKCNYCGGQFVYVINNNDTTEYRAQLTPPFNQLEQKVFIRYKIDTSDGLKELGGLIIISSIRNRNE
ncbi:hypothetical protein DSL64_13315 [Dyadobacter luteus]|uniref:Uncharacterized protein n=1 Tax=Dyadobacter luteus TaxID=2259619 RepID=A0A3D8YAS3_9BACT|nr:hypothetical protein [Dyadobacter luteus]REA60877.1 hypothetical protein DSL64_13315 [Dyadobacter luteus]